MGQPGAGCEAEVVRRDAGGRRLLGGSPALLLPPPPLSVRAEQRRRRRPVWRGTAPPALMGDSVFSEKPALRYAVSARGRWGGKGLRGAAVGRGARPVGS